MEKPIVFVVDDDASICESVRLLIEDVGLEVRAFTNPLEFLSQCNPNQEGCLVLDIRMPGMSGVELLSRLREQGIEIPAIIITGYADVPLAVAAMKAGALDFIEKPFRPQVLLDSIQESLKLDAQMRGWRRERRDLQSRLQLLTPREHEVLNHLITGKTNKTTAYELGISQKTVDFHRANILEKVGVESLVELVHLVEQSAAV